MDFKNFFDKLVVIGFGFILTTMFISIIVIGVFLASIGVGNGG